MKRENLTTAKVVEMLRVFGCSVSAAYVDQIALGHYRPGADVAIALSRAAGRRISVDRILSYPYKRKSKRAA